MALLFADENFPKAAVTALRELGHDAVTALEAGLANRRYPDDAILAWAAAHSRAVLTHDRGDYLKLHRKGLPHAGIIACTEDRDYRALAERIHRALSDTPELEGRVVR